MRLVRERLTVVWAAHMGATCISAWMVAKDAISPDRRHCDLPGFWFATQ